MSENHVDLPEQVVNPGEELWVKIIDLDLQRRRISLSIKQAAEGGVVAAEYQQHFGEHAYDDSGNYVGAPETVDAEQAWAEYYAEYGEGAPGGEDAPAGGGGANEAAAPDAAADGEEAGAPADPGGRVGGEMAPDESGPAPEEAAPASPDRFGEEGGDPPPIG